MANNILIYSNFPVLEEVLHKSISNRDFNVKFVTDIPTAINELKTNNFSIVLYDASSGIDGLLELSTLIQKENIYVDLLSIVDERDVDTAIETIKLGASDFITKPIDTEKVYIRIRVAIERYNNKIKDQMYKDALERKIKKKSLELWTKEEVIRKQFIGIMEALNNALQAKHPYTLCHSKRVGELSEVLAHKIALTEKEIREIETGAIFHDIGKIGIEDYILNKPDNLTIEEFEKIKMHPIIGENILKPIIELGGIISIVKYEHERWDGSGYPDKIKGEKIPLGARIIALSDAFDCITTERSYKKPKSKEFAIEEIEKNAGKQFDPDLSKVFINIISNKDFILSE